MLMIRAAGNVLSQFLRIVFVLFLCGRPMAICSNFRHHFATWHSKLLRLRNFSQDTMPKNNVCQCIQTDEMKILEISISELISQVRLNRKHASLYTRAQRGNTNLKQNGSHVLGEPPKRSPVFLPRNQTQNNWNLPCRFAKKSDVKL